MEMWRWWWWWWRENNRNEDEEEEEEEGKMGIKKIDWRRRKIKNEKERGK